MPKKPPVHRPPGWRPPEQRRRDFDKARQNEPSRKWYNTTRWRKLRLRVLRREPLCRPCQSMGIVTAANEVDHIIAHKGDEVLFWDESNLQPSCKPCHSRKTATEDSTFAKPR